MSFLFRSVIAQPPEDTYADTVERLVERIQTSTLLEDRRDACRALKSLSKKYRLEVGAQGMNALCTILQSDVHDNEIIILALETLINITSPSPHEEEETPADDSKKWETVGEQFTEIFIKHSDNVDTILNFLDESACKVRLACVQLLANLVTSKPREIQKIVLINPVGVSKLMDLLSDPREVVRNDTLLLLIQLTKSNADIQKLVAYESAFDKIFEVMDCEGYADGGIIVEDCLLFMLNLLRNNGSNQNYFKESSYIQRLKPMFELPQESHQQSELWLPQKVSNMYCVLQVIRSLVAPTNQGSVISSCQKTIFTSNILKDLCNIVMANGVPVNVLTESINAVAEIIRGNHANQEFFSSLLAPSDPPREALIILLMSMVNEKQQIELRCAVLYCFQCFLFKNEFGQSKVIQTLLPSPSTIENYSITMGQLLCAGLFSLDSVSNWFAAVALSHSLVDNPVQRELLLNVMLNSSAGSNPISLLQQITDILQSNQHLQSRIGFLLLLSTWLSHCPKAVNAFLHLPASIPFLINQIGAPKNDENEDLAQGLCAFLMGICIVFNDNTSASYSKDNLHQLIMKRISMEMYLDKLNEVSKHELYNKASKQPQIYCKSAKFLLLDYEFCKLFKMLESMVIKAVTRKTELSEVANRLEENIVQYKDVIRVNEKKITELAAENETLREQLSAYTTSDQQLRQHIFDLQQENTELKLKELALKDELSTAKNNTVLPITTTVTTNNDAVISKLEIELRRSESEKAALNSKMAQLQSDQEDLMILLSDQETQIEKYKAKLAKLGITIDEDTNTNNVFETITNDNKFATSNGDVNGIFLSPV